MQVSGRRTHASAVMCRACRAFGVAIEDEGNGADLWEARDRGAQRRSGTSQRKARKARGVC